VLPALSVADHKLDAAKQLTFSEEQIQKIKDHAHEFELPHKSAQAVVDEKLKDLYSSLYVGSTESSPGIKWARSSSHLQHGEPGGIRKAKKAKKAKASKSPKSSKSGKKGKKSDTCSGLVNNCSTECEDFFAEYDETAPICLCESYCVDCGAECGGPEDDSNEDCYDECRCKYIEQSGFEYIYEDVCLGNDPGAYCLTPEYEDLCLDGLEQDSNTTGFLERFNDTLPESLCSEEVCYCNADCDEIENADNRDECFGGCFCNALIEADETPVLAYSNCGHCSVEIKEDICTTQFFMGLQDEATVSALCELAACPCHFSCLLGEEFDVCYESCFSSRYIMGIATGVVTP